MCVSSQTCLYVLLEGTVCVQGRPGVADTNGPGGTSFSVTDGPGGPFIQETDGPGGTANHDRA